LLLINKIYPNVSLFRRKILCMVPLIVTTVQIAFDG